MNRILVILIVLVILFAMKDRLPLPLFRLPGDLEIRTERFHLLIPLATCIVVSLAASVLFALFDHFRR